MLRVISGKYRGKKLLLPPRTITRPTRDMVKEAIFSIINFDLPKSIILDAFAGSGSLAIEAVSRGAIKVVALETNSITRKVLETNINNLAIHNIDVLNRDALSYVQNMYGLKFDIIFLDPPFKAYDLVNNVLISIGQNELLKSQGYIILETDDPHKISLPPQLTIQKQKKYGINHILIITNN